ncbi:NlpC/P60 family protein [Paenibacillus sp. OV219]|uniref:C40 family peptidase n=1 Tax=Paenibacillus sp. OV219 TaxID=1884377 RepID=UPI0008B6CB3D|nr:NlpC/P60 family protein [Paenibacillus sp. OV219]SEN14761.1 Copper amine oxidase N-terminal domain-containing protein [Paenibacillus sp. OV219]
MLKRSMLLASTVLLLTSCSSGSGSGSGSGGSTVTKNNTAGSVVNLKAQGQASTIKTRHWEEKGGVWIPAERAATYMQYRFDENPKNHVASMGYADPVYTFKVGSKQAKIGDQQILLSDAPRMIDNNVCLELRSLSQLIQQPVRWDSGSSTVIIEAQKHQPPTNELVNTPPGTNQFRAQSTDMSTGDDNPDYDNPDNYDEYGNYIGGGRPGNNGNNGNNSNNGNNGNDVENGNNTADQDKVDEVISYGKRYMGVDYKFNAAAYAESRKFDCSSFIQHIFKHVGVDLPRSSRSQSTVGKYVSRKNFIPGDIVFFYTPGRYKTNNIVGHVGLYIGNNQVLQTYGNPGVTITKLLGNWDDRIMWGRRVL